MAKKTSVLVVMIWLLFMTSCQKTTEQVSPETSSQQELSINHESMEHVDIIPIPGYPDNMQDTKNVSAKESDEFFQLSAPSTQVFSVGNTSTVIITLSVSSLAAGREFRLDVISQNGQPFAISLKAKVGNTLYPVDSNNSPHAVRKTLKSVYFRKNMLPANAQQVLLYVTASTATPVQVKWRIGVSKKAFVKQLHLPNMANYIHFTQKDAPWPLNNNGCGPNTLLHAYHLQQPNIGAFYPNKDNLVALHNRLMKIGGYKTGGMFANCLYLHYLATGHRINVLGYKDNNNWNQSDYRLPNQGDFGRIHEYKNNAKQTDGSRYFPQVDDFGHVRNDRNSYRAFLEAPLPRGYAICTPVLIDGNNPANVKTTGKGHFILLTGISIAADGSGIVFYKDPLTVDTETRVINYTMLLDSNKANSGKGNYSGMYPKWIPN